MARPRQVLLLPQAAEDLQLIYDPLYTQVVKRLRLLRRYPRMGVELKGQFAGWRATPVEIFRIIYRITPRGIEVGYIRHCKREFSG